jgi:hypothetical protein
MRVNQLEQTSHSLARIRQRGFREIDAQLIVELGTEVRPGLFMLTKQDVDALIAELASFSGRLDYAWRGMSASELKRRVDGLQGAAIVADGLTFITVFHKMTPHLRTDPRRDPDCRRRRERRESERRKRSFHHWAPQH